MSNGELVCLHCGKTIHYPTVKPTKCPYCGHDIEEAVVSNYVTRTENEPVNPEFCKKCGFKGTPLCTHPEGYYQPEPEGLDKIMEGNNERESNHD